MKPISISYAAVTLLIALSSCGSEEGDTPGDGGTTCVSHDHQVCTDGVSYWNDSCGYRQDQAGTCACGCADDGSACKTDCSVCTPDCGTRVCGAVPNGCGDSCGTCASGEECDAGGQCQAVLACVQSFDNGLTTVFGRLDGVLHWVVLPLDDQCPSDDNHIKLQVRVNGYYYDIAVNVESTRAGDPRVYHYDLDAELLGGAWSEGWHTSGVDLDYARDLGVDSEDFLPATIDQLSALFATEIVAGGRVSIFMDSFGRGGHDIHRNDYIPDGAIVVDATGSPHYYLFRFADQSFTPP